MSALLGSGYSVTLKQIEFKVGFRPIAGAGKLSRPSTKPEHDYWSFAAVHDGGEFYSDHLHSNVDRRSSFSVRTAFLPYRWQFC